jgi:Domain of unknown function (DUF4395)
LVAISGISDQVSYDYGVFTFPNPVNEKAARVVAGVVAITAAIILATGAYWLLIPLTYGFWARVLTGPTLSPLGRAAMKLAPGDPKYVAGPPKRFAQGMGAATTTAATLLWLAGATTAAGVLTAMLLVAATLESVFAICLGCHVFALLMRAGLIPDSICAECADIRLARGRRGPAARQPSPRAP